MVTLMRPLNDDDRACFLSLWPSGTGNRVNFNVRLGGSWFSCTIGGLMDFSCSYNCVFINMCIVVNHNTVKRHLWIQISHTLCLWTFFDHYYFCVFILHYFLWCLYLIKVL
jgi:hypothetical protein